MVLSLHYIALQPPWQHCQVLTLSSRIIGTFKKMDFYLNFLIIVYLMCITWCTFIDNLNVFAVQPHELTKPVCKALLSKHNTLVAYIIPTIDEWHCDWQKRESMSPFPQGRWKRWANRAIAQGARHLGLTHNDSRHIDSLLKGHFQEHLLDCTQSVYASC